jgi:hypothetical protein
MRILFALCVGLLLAGCQVESRATIKVSQVLQAVANGQSDDIVIDAAAVWPSRRFCQNYRDRTKDFLQKQFSQIAFVKCERVSNGHAGHYKIRSYLIRTSGGPGEGKRILGSDLIAWGVYPNPRKGGGYEVGGVIDYWKAQDLKKYVEEEYRLDDQVMKFEMLLRNDSNRNVTVRTESVLINGALQPGKHKMTLAAGKSILIRLSQEKREWVKRNGYALFFTLEK